MAKAKSAYVCADCGATALQWFGACPVGDTICVFRDSAFTGDLAKTNLAAILERHGIQKAWSL